MADFEFSLFLCALLATALITLIAIDLRRRSRIFRRDLERRREFERRLADRTWRVKR
jgi:hypothetical protein